MKNSPSIKAISAALIKVQSKIQDAKFDSKNPHFKNDYASLESFLKVVRPSLTAEELAVTQGVSSEAGNHVLQTVLMHSSGEFITFEMPLLLGKQDMQGLGSAVTYARRYSLAALLGIGQEDDDGETSVGRDRENLPKTPSKNENKVEKLFTNEEEDPNADDLGEYVVAFGKKLAGKKIKDIDQFELAGYLDYLEKGVNTSGKQLTGKALELYQKANDYLTARQFEKR